MQIASRATSRRAFLAAAGATSLAAFGGTAHAQAPANAAPRRIDVHHHLTPPRYRSAIMERKLGERPTWDWTPAKSIEDMDKGGVALSVTSITYPGLWFGDNQAARDMARLCNDYAAELRSDHPGRFGIFGSLPLPDVDGSLKEIEYAFDTLKADGIGVMTSFGDKWLGHPSFDPVWAELNRRKAVVYTHPTVANCCVNVQPNIPPPIVEFGVDTTRTVADLVFTGTASKYADIKFIFSHAGGTVPFLVERFIQMPLIRKDVQARLPNGVLYELKKFHYDVAQASNPMALAALTRLVATSQILFGTDFPYRTSADHAKGLAEFGFSAADLEAIDHGNALRLLPTLKV
jgi:predicted TIM-barrel fold metal-dependent hydrolase